VATSDSTLRVKAGDTDASGIKGAALIVAGEPPDEAELTRIHTWLQTQPNGKDLDMNYLRNKTKTALLTASVMVITGSAVVDGNTSFAQHDPVDTRADIPTNARYVIDAIAGLDPTSYSSEQLHATTLAFNEATLATQTRLANQLVMVPEEFVEQYGRSGGKEAGVHVLIDRKSGLIPNTVKGLSYGAYCSFAHQSRDYEDRPDIVFSDGKLHCGVSTVGVFDYGAIVAANGPTASKAFDSLVLEDVPAELVVDKKTFKESRKLQTLDAPPGMQSDSIAPEVGATYFVRGAHDADLSVKGDRSKRGTERWDTVAAIRILEKNEWRVTIAWKILKQEKK
ncbi:MAG: hypothetical protein L6Q71_02655, partial [Planctomycetes bacterium]|nr:hypothetical protein [Planctomycetota bacterium]